ncbi:hypothetical protein Xbed_03528 [Xenorhabdus beddingii]|uniref:Uncharacterized protein n=1 Tax=Xenorhabdus beddingii TaxID=40578 RepID=A0A1Y2SEQ6_9GAMM|nr:hypothetical protein [Xenorhabdus beddingii]OTA16056.1 hypothetical protein Xbed_03528 [Xenorhabdus beddingii]
MKTVKVDWLGDCEKCGMDSALIETNGNENWLYEGDVVTCCGCGHTGHVEILQCEPVAYAVWDELVEVEA